MAVPTRAQAQKVVKETDKSYAAKSVDTTDFLIPSLPLQVLQFLGALSFLFPIQMSYLEQYLKVDWYYSSHIYELCIFNITNSNSYFSQEKCILKRLN